jgi:hypothetical protein
VYILKKRLTDNEQVILEAVFYRFENKGVLISVFSTVSPYSLSVFLPGISRLRGAGP